jgi:predicted TPR repeat methyltransferase
MANQQHNIAPAERANQLLVEGLLGAGKQKEAIDLCIRICSGPGAGPRDWLMLGCLFADTANVARAKVALDKAVELDPGLAEAHFALGKLLAATGTPQSAIAQLEKAAELMPDNAQVWLTLGITCGLAKQPGKAEEYCRRSLELQPDSAMARFNLGNALQGQGKLAEAVSEYESAVALDPRMAKAWSMLAQARFGLRQPEEAKQAAQRALTLNPGLGEAHFTLGNALHALGERDQAIESLREAVRLLPRDAKVHLRLGELLFRKGDYAAASDSLFTVTKLTPNSIEAHFHLGLCFINRRMAGRAENCFRRVVAINKDHVRAHYQLALLLGKMGRREESAKHFAEVLRISPDDGTAKHLLAAQRGETTQTAPAGYVKTLFDGFAEIFDTQLLDELQYRAPQELFDFIARHMPSSPGSLDVIDLGCGTGLCGPLFRGVARKLHGVDLSPGMIEKARARNVYDSLEVNDIATSLAGADSAWDMAISTDVFIYVGDLRETFVSVRDALRSGGWFAFSVEADDEADSFVLRSTGRYAHAARYIRSLATEYGFEEVAQHTIELRKEKGNMLMGHLFLLRRGNDAG